MPVVYDEFQVGEPRDISQIPSLRRDVLTETFAATFEENPIMATMRWNELRIDEKTGPKLDAATARQRLTDAGYENDIQVNEGGITEGALTTLMERKRIERRRADVFSRAQGGLAEGASRFGLSMATSLADPVSAGLNFVPVVGQARYARWTATASFAQRAAIRTGVGAAEGSVGSAIAEVPVTVMRRSEQADYTAADSLLNIALGGVLGAGLHVTVGTTGEGLEFLRARRSPIERMPGLSYGERIIEMRAGGRVLNTEAAEKAYAEIPETQGGRVLNTDVARELSPEYRGDRTLAAAVHEPSSFLIKQLYARRLAEAPKEGEAPVVVFTAGGAGAGKSTGLELVAKSHKGELKAQIIYDTNLDKLPGAIQKIDQALAAGKQVDIQYTFRDPVEALTKGALTRAMRMGRTVPLETHAKTHVGAAATIKALAEKYQGDPRVRIDIIDNSRGPNKAVLSSVEAVPALEYNRVRDDLLKALEAEHRAGRISDAVYRGTLGQARKGEVRAGQRSSSSGRSSQLGPPGQVLNETAAERAAVATPEVREAALRAAVGQAVTGQPINVDGIFNATTARDAGGAAMPAPERVPENTEYTAAQARADEVETEPFDNSLESAQQEADLAIADAKAIADRLGIETKDPELEAVEEGVALAEKWAKAAEVASTCLLRGG